MSLYDFSVKAQDGNEVSLADYQAKVLLIVNTATGCGLTPQYTGLQELYETYHDQGFEILDFPCNQFGNQAPGSDEEIDSFCTTNYHTSFPRFAKVDVNGPNEDPLFAFLKNQKKGLGGSKIKWNFTKFLINKDGKVVERFAPTDSPQKIEAKIATLL